MPGTSIALPPQPRLSKQQPVSPSAARAMNILYKYYDVTMKLVAFHHVASIVEGSNGEPQQSMLVMYKGGVEGLLWRDEITFHGTMLDNRERPDNAIELQFLIDFAAKCVVTFKYIYPHEVWFGIKQTPHSVLRKAPNGVLVAEDVSVLGPAAAAVGMCAPSEWAQGSDASITPRHAIAAKSSTIVETETDDLSSTATAADTEADGE